MMPNHANQAFSRAELNEILIKRADIERSAPNGFVYLDETEEDLISLVDRLETRIQQLNLKEGNLSPEERRECLEIQRALSAMEESLNEKKDVERLAQLSVQFRTQVMDRISNTPKNKWVVPGVAPEIAEHIAAEFEEIIEDAEDSILEGDSYADHEARRRINTFVQSNRLYLSEYAFSQADEICGQLYTLAGSTPCISLGNDFREAGIKMNREKARARTAVEQAIKKIPAALTNELGETITRFAKETLHSKVDSNHEIFLVNETSATEQIQKYFGRLAQILARAPHMKVIFESSAPTVHRIFGLTPQDFKEYLEARVRDQDDYEWAESNGIPNENLPTVTRFRKKMQRLTEIIGEEEFFQKHYLRKDQIPNYFMMEDLRLENVIESVERFVCAHKIQKMDGELLGLMPNQISDEYENEFADEIITADINPTIVPDQKSGDVVLNGSMDDANDRMASAKLEYQIKEIQKEITRKRRIGRVATLVSMAAGLLMGVFSLDKGAAHMESHLAEVAESISETQSSSSKNAPQLHNVSYDDSLDHPETNTYELAKRVTNERHSMLSDIEKRRLAAASTNTAIMALAEDKAPHVNPAIPAELSISYLEKWEGYKAPIDAFDAHLSSNGLDRKDASTGELLEFVENNNAIGGAGTEMLIDRMLGSVPSLALDQTQSTQGLADSMELVMNGSVESLARTTVKQLDDAGFYETQEDDELDDVTALLQPFNGDVNSIMDDVSDLPPEPLHVKPAAKEIPDVSEHLELVNDEKNIDVNSLMNDPSDLPPEPLHVKPVVEEIPDLTDDLELIDEEKVEQEWFTPEEPVKPVKKSWFQRAKQKVSRWFS